MKKFLSYIITFAAGAAVAVAVLVSRGTFVQTNIVTVYRDLCDAFFIPGVIIACMGALVFASNGGTFDMLAYGVRKLFDLFKRDVLDVKYRTFYDYRKAQQEKKRSFGFMLVVGCVFIAVAAVFLVLYQSNIN